MVFKSKKCFGGRLRKECVTVLVRQIMNRMDKLKPLIIGKLWKIYCFKKTENQPCNYRSQSKAWMTSDKIEFMKWNHKFNEQMKRKSKKVLCLTDNCSTYPNDIPACKTSS